MLVERRPPKEILFNNEETRLAFEKLAEDLGGLRPVYIEPSHNNPNYFLGLNMEARDESGFTPFAGSWAPTPDQALREIMANLHEYCVERGLPLVVDSRKPSAKREYKVLGSLDAGFVFQPQAQQLAPSHPAPSATSEAKSWRLLIPRLRQLYKLQT